MSLDPDDADDACACPPKLALSMEEEEVLRRMRSVRDEAREIKRLLAADDAQQEDRQRDLERDLELLRQRFSDLKEELRQANRIKLIRLGHRP